MSGQTEPSLVVGELNLAAVNVAYRTERGSAGCWSQLEIFDEFSEPKSSDLDSSIRRYRGCAKTKRADFSMKGWQIVAGGRSVAQTTGKECSRIRTPEGCHRFSDTRSGCAIIFDCGPVVCATLRPPATI